MKTLVDAEQIEIAFTSTEYASLWVPAKWMQEATSAKPNNFVQVSKQDDGFTAEMGKETFDVRLLVDTRDGQILSAAMHNPVALTTRTCTDRELTQCGPEASKTIFREITWKLVP